MCSLVPRIQPLLSTSPATPMSLLSPRGHGHAASGLLYHLLLRRGTAPSTLRPGAHTETEITSRPFYIGPHTVPPPGPPPSAHPGAWTLIILFAKIKNGLRDSQGLYRRGNVSPCAGRETHGRTRPARGSDRAHLRRSPLQPPPPGLLRGRLHFPACPGVGPAGRPRAPRGA